MKLAGLCLLAAAANIPDASDPPRGGGAAPHAIAFINDPLSHGVLGDDYLSLNEVILLHNRQLQWFHLSVNEQNQISGFGQDIAWADIDATATPTITVERDLDIINDQPHGLLISGSNGLPVIDFTASTVQHGFRAVSNYCNWRYLLLRGGPYGIDVQQTDSLYGTYIDTVVFENHTLFALRCTGSTANENTRVLLNHCEFRGVPSAMRFDEQAPGRIAFLYIGDTKVGGATAGLEILLGNGGSMLCWFERSELNVPGSGIRIARPGGADRALTIEATHLHSIAGNALAIEGAPNAATQLVLRMLRLEASVPGGKALAIGPLDGRISGAIDECTMIGDVDVHTGGSGNALTIGNARIRNGNVSLGTSASQPLVVRDTRFDGCQIVSTGQGTIAMTGSCLAGGSIQGSIVAPFQCTSSFVGSAIGSGVVTSSGLPAAQLGSMQVLPIHPMLGGNLTVQVDLPPGLYAFLAMGVTAATPFIQAPPMHVYLDIATVYTFPGIYRLQQGITFPVPNNVMLRGTDWVAQMAAFPDPGVQAPNLQLPPGRRFVLH